MTATANTTTPPLQPPSPTATAKKPLTALISGGAKGIGRCLTRRFCELDYRVYVLDIDEPELEYTVHTHLKQYSEAGKLGYSVCNLRDLAEVQKSVDEAAEFLGGRIDVLINNGGIATPQWKDGATMADKETLVQWQAYVYLFLPPSTLPELDSPDLYSRPLKANTTPAHSYIETNLTAPFAVSQACLPYMRHEAGSALALHSNDSNTGPCIIHIGSFRAHQSDPNQEGYASSKAGQLGLMQSMAISLAQWGIRVNLIAPGRIKVAHECRQGDEEGVKWEDQNSEGDVEHHPTNRAGRPKDIADAAEYLVSAGFVSGQEITIDGGASKKKA